jgi:hypothetical protein
MSLIDKYSILRAEELSATERAKRLGVSTLPDQPHFRSPNQPSSHMHTTITVAGGKGRTKEVKVDRDEEKRLDRERRARTGNP